MDACRVQTVYPASCLVGKAGAQKTRVFLLFSVAFGGVAGATGGRGELMLVSQGLRFYRDIATGAFGIPVCGPRVGGYVCALSVVR